MNIRLKALQNYFQVTLHQGLSMLELCYSSFSWKFYDESKSKKRFEYLKKLKKLKPNNGPKISVFFTFKIVFYEFLSLNKCKRRNLFLKKVTNLSLLPSMQRWQCTIHNRTLETFIC